MLEEEERMREAAERDDSEGSKRASQWASAGKTQQQGQFQKLMRLVEKSKVFASIMQQRMQQEEEKRQAKTEAERKKMEKKEAEAEKVAGGQMRRGTRTTTGATKEEADTDGQKAEEAEGRKLPVRTRGRPKKGEKKDGSISAWLKKEDVDKKTGGMTVSEAVAEAAEEYEAKESGSFGASDLRSANQPAAVTGGIMRSYQLEGLYWLRSLYENGLNGILGE